MNLRCKINYGFLIIVLIMAIVSGLIIYQQAKMQTAFEDSLRTCDLDRYLLECRRQEKNYICCESDQKAIEQFQTNYDTLFVMTDDLSNKVVNKDVKKELHNLQENLVKFYEAFMQTIQYRDDATYKLQFDISSKVCIKYARECHSIIGRIQKHSYEKFEKALAVSSIINTFSVIIGIFLSIVISSFLADRIIDFIGSPEAELLKKQKDQKKK